MREDRLTQWNVNLEATINERTTELERAMKIVEKTNSAMASELAEAAAYARAVLPPKIKGRVTTDWDFEASSELGGDSFGYHWVDDDHFAIYLLDVCGHGVGAALLSISVVNLLRTSSLTETDFLDPSAVLASLNETFPMEQHNDMYFTAWYGVYQASTREIRFACAGHPPAVLISREGKASQLSASGVIVGAFPAAKFETRCIVVPEGSQLYLFSDGVYEIDRPNKPMMTYDEFVEILSNTTEKASIEKIVSEVKHQQGTNSFADDFSLIQLCFLEPKLTSDECVILNNSMEEWSKLLRFTEKFGIDHGISNDDIVSVDVIIEEIVTNIIKYGGVPPDTETCRVELNLRGTFLEIKISDNGNPFNPLLLPEVDTDQGIESRPIGGLGIHFVKKLTTSQYYEYCNKQNVLTLIKEL